jgi:serine/threonine protein phosphatase PrpC
MLLKMETIHVSGAGETHRGSRPSNQDALVIAPDLGLYAVLDGMGGAAAGETAARLASETLIEFIRSHSASELFTPRELLEFAIDRAAAAVYLTGKREPACNGMGTTVVACLVVNPTCIAIGHVGDSRAYLLRNGCLQVLTRDHTIAQKLIDEGELAPDDLELTQFQHMLTRNLGDEPGVQADMLEVLLQAGDRVLLCSDGLHGCVLPEAVQRVLSSSDAPQETARALVELALNSGQASDNVSAVVLDVGQPRARACVGTGSGARQRA